MPGVVNTELGSGLREARAIKKTEPEDVAEAIVAALERPKFDVYVPRESVVVYKLGAILPRSGWSHRSSASAATIRPDSSSTIGWYTTASSSR